jgi:hypothetical protein
MYLRFSPDPEWPLQDRPPFQGHAGAKNVPAPLTVDSLVGRATHQGTLIGEAPERIAAQQLSGIVAKIGN